MTENPITVNARELAATLSYMKRAVALRKGHIAPMHAVLLTAEYRELTVSHTGWEHAAQARILTEGGAAFTVAVNLDQLLAAAKMAGIDRLRLAVADGTGNLIARGGGGMVVVPSIVDKGGDQDGYPLASQAAGSVPRDGELQMTGKALADLVGAVAVAASTDKTTPSVMNVLIGSDGGGFVTAVATDRYRLMTATGVAMDQHDIEMTVAAPAVWLAETAKHLSKDRAVTLTQTVRAGHTWLTLHGQSGTFAVDCTTDAMQYPMVAGLFHKPEHADAVLTVDPAAWAKAIKGWKGSSIRLHVEGVNTVQAERHPGGDASLEGRTEASGEMALQMSALSGEPITAQFDAAFLASILATAPKGVTAELRITAPNRPMMITWDSVRHLLMSRRFTV